MTTIVGIQGKGWSVMAADTQITDDNNSVVSSKTPKIIKFKQIAVGLRGDARPGDILTYNWSPPHVYGNPQKWIGAKMIPSLIEKFNELGYDWNDENSDFNFLICVKKELFDIGSDLSITRSDDNIYTTGSGKNIALGYLAGKSWKTKEEAALLAIEAVNTASKYDIHTGGPVQVEII